jgi:hypothetical protein
LSVVSQADWKARRREPTGSAKSALIFFETETIGTPGCKYSESTQANEGWQWVTEAD